jgi:hypothetical protein
MERTSAFVSVAVWLCEMFHPVHHRHLPSPSIQIAAFSPQVFTSAGRQDELENVHRCSASGV